MAKKEDFNAYFGRQLKYNSNMLEHLDDYMANVKGELKLISKHASMVTTQVEQVLKAQNDLLNELNNKKNDNDVRVVPTTGSLEACKVLSFFFFFFLEGPGASALVL